ncbi:hypothetical protein I4U23_031381 [Adineta vaga]|nr:hypothetical protein I4U23_031381 [Adineta vaga]
MVLNYTYLEHICHRCSDVECKNYDCVDEYFHLSYSIYNGTTITSIYKTIDRKGFHRPVQIGCDYSCYYLSNYVTSVILDLISTKKYLILLCICFGIIVVTCVLPLAFVICAYIISSGKFDRPCSYVTNKCVSFKNICIRKRNKTFPQSKIQTISIVESTL